MPPDMVTEQIETVEVGTPTATYCKRKCSQAVLFTVHLQRALPAEL